MKQIRKMKIKVLLKDEYPESEVGSYVAFENSDGTEGYIMNINSNLPPEKQEEVFLLHCLNIWRHNKPEKESDRNFIKQIREATIPNIYISSSKLSLKRRINH